MGLKRVPVTRRRLLLYLCLDGTHVPMHRTDSAGYPAPEVPRRTLHGGDRLASDDWKTESTCPGTPTGYFDGKETRK